jgi:hypothetical protein
MRSSLTLGISAIRQNHHPTINPISIAPVKLKTALALCAFAVSATATQAAVSFQTFNISSGYGGEEMGISYNFTTLSVYNSGEQVGAVMARSGFDPEVGFETPSYLNGDYYGGLNQAKVSATSVSFGTTIDSSLTWSARINLPQGRGDTFMVSALITVQVASAMAGLS